MPALPGFFDNELVSREDVLRAATAILNPLRSYKTTSGARIKLSTATGTGFDEISAQLEGYARPLWVVADLLKLSTTADKTTLADFDSSSSISIVGELGLESWVRGLAAGVNPGYEGYWGDLGNHDQRMVEMEPIAYALLTAPAMFSLEAEDFSNLKAWLSSINERVMPPSNWRWFRVLVNLALIKYCNIPYDDIKPVMDADFEVLDSMYLGEGWSSDGVWSADKKQADYYSGSFAIQYSQLAYIRFAAEIDPDRVAKYRDQARQFSTTFWRYFNVNGAAIPFGRSLTYRFAFTAFFSAAVTAGVDLPAPLDHMGIVKGFILRHLRWWAKQPNIFNTDGTFNIGYTYPNMYMSEDYNSPQSSYWSLKTFSVLGLPNDHEFWGCKELPHPLKGNRSVAGNVPKSQFTSVACVKPAMHITCSHPEHHFLLSSGQFTKKTHRAREAKYGKFAYSSAFGFSVPVGNLLEQLAPDSTLSISNDDRESWKVRWDPVDAHFEEIMVSTRNDTKNSQSWNRLPILVSTWQPWKALSVSITSILTPVSDKWPGWHVRLHKLSWIGPGELDVVDAGFAISNINADGSFIPEFGSDASQITLFSTKGFIQDSFGCLVVSEAGASGVATLGLTSAGQTTCTQQGITLKPDANTNLITQRTVIPTIQHHFTGGSRPRDTAEHTAMKTIWFATGVFAVSSEAGMSQANMLMMWKARPEFILVNSGGNVVLRASEKESAEEWQLGVHGNRS